MDCGIEEWTSSRRLIASRSKALTSSCVRAIYTEGFAALNSKKGIPELVSSAGRVSLLTAPLTENTSATSAESEEGMASCLKELWCSASYQHQESVSRCF